MSRNLSIVLIGAELGPLSSLGFSPLLEEDYLTYYLQYPLSLFYTSYKTPPRSDRSSRHISYWVKEDQGTVTRNSWNEDCSHPLDSKYSARSPQLLQDPGPSFPQRLFGNQPTHCDS